MPDKKRIRVYYEGDDDRVVLEGLQSMALLPNTWEIAKRDKNHPGKDGLVRELTPFVRPISGVGGTAITLIDLDDLTIERLIDWFRPQVEKIAEATQPPMNLQEQHSENGRVSLFTISAGDLSGRVALVPVGLANDSELRTTFGIEKFAVDDHILRLVREQRIFAAVSEMEAISHEVAMRKMGEVANLLRANGIAIQHSKRLLHILRAVAAVRPSSATVIGRLMEQAQKSLSTSELRTIFHPLVDDIEAAARMLNG